MTATTARPAESGSNFFFGFLFLPAEKREALSAVYSYCRLIDDIVDEPGIKAADAAKTLDFWVEEIGRLYKGGPTHPVARRLLAHVGRYDLPQEAFLEMIRGCRMDLERSRYADMAELESYMRGVAGSVGLLSVRIFGFRHTPAAAIAQFALGFGYAFQLTNIIRDVGDDLSLGRVYLPDSEIAAAGYSREQLLRREHTPAFERLLGGLHERAKRHYREARAAVDPLDRPSLLPAEVMAHIYEAILDEIAAGGFQVMSRRAKLSAWRKASLAAQAWLFCHGF